MKIKTGVQMAGLQPVMRLALVTAEKIWLKYNQELVVTSALDGEHAAGSWHYYGYALDFRSRYFPVHIAQKVAKELQEACPGSYEVIYHEDHIHIHYAGPKDRFTVNPIGDEKNGC